MATKKKNGSGDTAIMDPEAAELAEIGLDAVTGGALPGVFDLDERAIATFIATHEVEREAMLEEGKGLHGVYIGEGPDKVVHDRITQEEKRIPTWRIDVEGLVVRLYGGVRLRSAMAGLVGHEGKHCTVVRCLNKTNKQGNPEGVYMAGPQKAV